MDVSQNMMGTPKSSKLRLLGDLNIKNYFNMVIWDVLGVPPFKKPPYDWI